MINNYISFVQNYYKLIFILALLVVISPFGNLGTLGLSNDMRVYFSEDNEYRKSLNLLEDTFGAQDNLLIYIESKEGDLFNKKSLSIIKGLTDKLWETPYSRRVDSLTNYQRTAVDEDELVIDFLADRPSNLTTEEIAEIKEFALSSSTLRNRVISEKGNASAINLVFSFPPADPTSIEDIPTLAAKEALAHVEALLEKVKLENPELKIELGGVVAANLTMAKAVERDLGTLLPASYLILFGVIFLCTGSLIFVGLTFLIVTLSILSAIAIYGFTGFPLSPATGFIPPAIMAIAVADCIHFFTGYTHSKRAGKDHKNAVVESLRSNVRPIIITSVTTTIGLLGLNFSESQPYRDMGNTMAIGVAVALFLTLTLLPSLMLMFRNVKSRELGIITNHMNGLANVVTAHARLLCLATLILIMFGSIGFMKNHISERWYVYFGEEFEIRQTVESINDNLTGIHVFQYALDTGSENGVYNPQYWKEVEEFSNWLRTQEHVAHVDSLSDTIKSINQNMNQGNPSYYKIPQERELVAQYLLVYEFGLPQGLGIETYISIDRSSSRLTASLKKTDSEYMTKLDSRAKEWLESNTTTINPTHGTGMDLMFSRIAQDNAISLLQGTLAILVIVSFIMLVILRSIKLGIISIIPNVIPAVIAYGIWGYFKGTIDLSSSVVICISLGIVVDDTVHYLSKYKYAKDSLAMTTIEAIKFAYNYVGSAMIITTVALVSGLFITVFSSFQPSANIGILLSLTISLALIIDLLLLPALLILFDSKESSGMQATTST